MNLPGENSYIDIHTHAAESRPGLFSVDSLMAHEERQPGNISGVAFSYGIHPWFLDEDNSSILAGRVLKAAGDPNVIAIGEAGFDKLRGPALELQRKIFEQQISIAHDHHKPVVIHCVRGWDELLMAHKKINPKTKWLIHGFRGRKELAAQLIAKGMFLSFWFDFILRTESTELIRSVPRDRIFLESDGADVDIKDIYNKVSADLDISVEELKLQIHNNFNRFFTNVL